MASLFARYAAVRDATERLCTPLEPDDYGLQPMADASPVKWHLAHTSWFFETFLLKPHAGDYREFHSQFGYLFNSYYEAVGQRHPRAHRGLLSRPTVTEVHAYRRHVDSAVTRWLTTHGPELPTEVTAIIEIGLQHEQQHQELILTDLKAGLAANPLFPVYQETDAVSGLAGTWKRDAEPESREFQSFPGGLVEVGHDGGGFAFDNEGPRHKVFLHPFEIATHPVTVGEFREFIADGGYLRPELWLSDGWAVRKARGWSYPRYWQDDGYRAFTLSGVRSLDPQEPVCHVSFYESDAFARWAGCRLPTEFEWEIATAGLDPSLGNFADDGAFHPSPPEPSSRPGSICQAFGDCWEWTASPYSAYPGYRPAAGALGEYNGKFMCNQMVLRGGSCATPRGHVRRTYRNFFPPDARWQFSGFRLARDGG